MAAFLQQVKEDNWDDHYVPTESWLQRKDREQLEKKQQAEYTITEGYKNECVLPFFWTHARLTRADLLCWACFADENSAVQTTRVKIRKSLAIH